MATIERLKEALENSNSLLTKLLLTRDHGETPDEEIEEQIHENRTVLISAAAVDEQIASA